MARETMLVPSQIRIPKLIAGFLVALSLLPCACSRPPPEQALRASVADVGAAIEARDASALRDLLAEDFVGNDGLDRDGVRRIAALQFMRNDAVGVVLGPLSIDLQPASQPTHATVRCTAVLTGGAGGLLPESGSLYDVESGWRLDADEWRMTSLAWTQR